MKLSDYYYSLTLLLLATFLATLPASQAFIVKNPSFCKPQTGINKTKCQKLIKDCRNKFNIEMKWVGIKPCKVVNKGGCQCGTNCKYLSPCGEATCLANPRCRWTGPETKCEPINPPLPMGADGSCPPPGTAATFSPSASPTRPAPSVAPTTSRPSYSPSTSRPSNAPSTSRPSTAPSTSRPSQAPTETDRPSVAPSTAQPSQAPVTLAPSRAPSTSRPSNAPSTAQPSKAPTETDRPSAAPSTTRPSTAPSTTRPSTAPSTTRPSNAPSTTRPSNAPSTTRPSMAPVTAQPTQAPTVGEKPPFYWAYGSTIQLPGGSQPQAFWDHCMENRPVQCNAPVSCVGAFMAFQKQKLPNVFTAPYGGETLGFLHAGGVATTARCYMPTTLALRGATTNTVIRAANAGYQDFTNSFATAGVVPSNTWLWFGSRVDKAGQTETADAADTVCRSTDSADAWSSSQASEKGIVVQSSSTSWSNPSTTQTADAGPGDCDVARSFVCLCSNVVGTETCEIEYPAPPT